MSDKSKIIRDFEEKKLSKAEIYSKYGMKRQTFNSVLQQLDKILLAISNSDISISRKRIRFSTLSDLEEFLLKWFRQKRDFACLSVAQ